MKLKTTLDCIFVLQYRVKLKRERDDEWCKVAVQHLLHIFIYFLREITSHHFFFEDATKCVQCSMMMNNSLGY